VQSLGAAAAPPAIAIKVAVKIAPSQALVIPVFVMSPSGRLRGNDRAISKPRHAWDSPRQAYGCRNLHPITGRFAFTWM
jgi:hypothetical protein